MVMMVLEEASHGIESESGHDEPDSIGVLQVHAVVVQQAKAAGRRTLLEVAAAYMLLLG